MVGSHLADYLLERTDWNLSECAAGAARWTTSRTCSRAPIAKTVCSSYTATCAIRCRCRTSSTKRRPDYVFHLAAQSYPTTSFTSPLDTSTPTSRARRGCSRRCARQRPRSGHPRLRVIRSVRARTEGQGADRRGMHLSPGFALCDLEGRHRSGRPFPCRSLRAEGHDDAHVHAHGSAARRCVRRIDFREADRDDRSTARSRRC